MKTSVFLVTLSAVLKLSTAEPAGDHCLEKYCSEPGALSFLDEENQCYAKRWNEEDEPEYIHLYYKCDVELNQCREMDAYQSSAIYTPVSRQHCVNLHDQLTTLTAWLRDDAGVAYYADPDSVSYSDE